MVLDQKESNKRRENQGPAYLPSPRSVHDASILSLSQLQPVPFPLDIRKPTQSQKREQDKQSRRSRFDSPPRAPPILFFRARIPARTCARQVKGGVRPLSPSPCPSTTTDRQENSTSRAHSLPDGARRSWSVPIARSTQRR